MSCLSECGGGQRSDEWQCGEQCRTNAPQLVIRTTYQPKMNSKVIEL